MTLLRYLFDDQPDGTTATSANTGLGITTGGGTSGTVTYSSDYGVNGSTGLKMSCTAIGGSLGIRIPMSAASNQVQVTVVVKTPTFNPANPANLIVLRHTSGVCGRVVWGTSGQLQFSDTVHTVTNITSAGALSLDTQYHIAVTSVGGSETAGQVTVKAYALSDKTFSTALASLTLNNANLTTNNFTDVQLCEGSAIGDMGFDTFQVNDGAGGQIPYYETAVTVTVNALLSKTVEPETSVSYTATSSQAIAVWTWRQISGPPVILLGSGATRTFTAPSIMPPKNNVVLGVKGTYNGAESSEVQAIVTVLPQIRWMRSGSTWVGQHPSL